jgi:hypothetical protein
MRLFERLSYIFRPGAWFLLLTSIIILFISQVQADNCACMNE